ncbi:MAG: MFS transporter [Bacillota bacterium]|nr:MFS transporter [Bacillota bacterium]
MKRQKVFSNNEIKFLASMGLVMGFRELALSMLDPFITIYGKTLVGNTTFLCGLALGIYGLTNAAFQIPYGSLSDRIGRKPVILIGLIQLFIGLLLAGLTKNIYLFILARALQGSGAVTAIAYSWIGDNIEDSKKNRAMGIAGIIIALGALVAFVIGPILYNIMDVNSMFLWCSFFILVAILFINFSVEDSSHNQQRFISHKDGIAIKEIKILLKNKYIILLGICGFIFNFALSEMFFIVPDQLRKEIGVKNMWYVFLPAVILGIVIMNIGTMLSDNGYFTLATITAFFMLAFGFIALICSTLLATFIGTILIVSSFMCLTTVIPSSLNKFLDKNKRGAANGLFQTLAFSGFFTGSTVAGFVLEHNYMILIYMVPISLSIIGSLCINCIKSTAPSLIPSVDN